MSGHREPVIPPVDGSLTIPDVVDFHLRHNAELPIYAFNRDGSTDVTEISFLEFAHACHRAAHHVRPRRTGSDNQVVAIIALADTIVYQAVIVGLMRAGLVPFPISPRNTSTAVIHLLKETSCHRVITTPTTLRTLIDAVKSELAASDPDFELVVEEIPSLAQIYPKLGAETARDPFEPYPQSARPPPTDIALYLHSSGSTGLPKPIHQTYLTLSHWIALPPIIAFRDYRPRPRLASMALPTFHTLGIHSFLIHSLFGMNCIGVYPPLVTSRESLPMMPTPDNILDHARRTGTNAMVTVPSLLQIWATSEEAVDLLKTLEFVVYAGGAVAPKLGNFMVASGVKLRSAYGGTEFGSPTFPTSRLGDETDWAYMEFGQRTKVRWVPQGDGTYECQFLTTETHSLPIENLPDVKGYATSDLWERHPTKEYLWKIVGRIDDVIIHSSGEKTVPPPMEDIVISSPLVMGTVMFGREHDQPGILIEPKAGYAIDVEDEAQLVNLRNALWPIIEEANQVAPAFSRVFKEMILITARDKPLPRAGKGTVLRKMALETYDREIEALYATVESTAKGEDVVPPASWTKGDIEKWLLEQAIDIFPGKGFSLSGDVFDQGFDSLAATILRRRITGALRSGKDVKTLKAAEVVTQNTMYNHPTIEKLASFLAALVADPQGFVGSDNAKAAIEAMIEKYSVGLEGSFQPSAMSTSLERRVVLLTGSTGNLGSQILAELLQDVSVERVYVLNRASSGFSSSMFERHKERFVGKGLDVGLLASQRLVFIEGDTTKAQLGLSETLYNEIRDSVSVFIHNAWRLDFNISLASFESNVRGTRNIVDLVRSGPSADSSRLLFTSSIASAQSWNKANGPIPEEVMDDAGVAVGNGYGEGKYVSERILAKSGLQATSLRIGQISGGLPNGAWATTDWVPILVKSSLALGVLPSAVGVVSWIPMDAVAKAILDVAFSQERPPLALNLVHPRPISWDIVISSIQEILEQDITTEDRKLRVVPFPDWFALLAERSKTATDADLRMIPAIKLLEFYRSMADADSMNRKAASRGEVESGGLAKFATEKARGIIPTMAELAPIGSEDARRWIKYWRAVGLF